MGGEGIDVSSTGDSEDGPREHIEGGVVSLVVREGGREFLKNRDTQVTSSRSPVSFLAVLLVILSRYKYK